jgi:hypothetical protein
MSYLGRMLSTGLRCIVAEELSAESKAQVLYPFLRAVTGAPA